MKKPYYSPFHSRFAVRSGDAFRGAKRFLRLELTLYHNHIEKVRNWSFHSRHQIRADK